MPRKNFEELHVKTEIGFVLIFYFGWIDVYNKKHQSPEGKKLHKVLRKYLWNNAESMIYTGAMKHVGRGGSQKISRTFPAQVRAIYSGKPEYSSHKLQ